MDKSQEVTVEVMGQDKEKPSVIKINGIPMLTYYGWAGQLPEKRKIDWMDFEEVARCVWMVALSIVGVALMVLAVWAVIQLITGRLL